MAAMMVVMTKTAVVAARAIRILMSVQDKKVRASLIPIRIRMLTSKQNHDPHKLHNSDQLRPQRREQPDHQPRMEREKEATFRKQRRRERA